MALGAHRFRGGRKKTVKILTVLGARPQFVKAAVVSRGISRHNASAPKEPIEELLIHTGQHYDANMSDIFFEDMRLPKPDYSLGIGGGGHGRMTGRMLEAIEAVILKERPDAVLVYGDTNSTLAGALAAVKLHVRVAHVEAGLRSYNMRMPEEVNRVLTDHVSGILFCPTEAAVSNLGKEGLVNLSGNVNGRKNTGPVIVNIGDVMYDAALFYGKIARPTASVSSIIEKCKNGFYLATVHRAENTDDPERLAAIFSALDEISVERPVVMPLHPRTRKLISASVKSDNLIITEPVGYFDMINLLSNCNAVFTDSGGVQKEAYFFGKSCITLRDETEWVELVDEGFNTLAGADRGRIIEAEKRLNAAGLDFSKMLYGDGRAGEKIVRILSEMA